MTRAFLLTIAVALFPDLVAACSITEIQRFGDTVTVVYEGGQRTASVDMGECSGGWEAKVECAEDLIQSRLDERFPLVDLPEDEPMRLSDPATPRWFWDGADLVYRRAVIDAVVTGNRQAQVYCYAPEFAPPGVVD